MKSSPESKRRAYEQQQTAMAKRTADLQRDLAAKVAAGGEMTDFWQELLDESIESHGDAR